MSESSIHFQPIGVIHAPSRQPSQTPIQAAGAGGNIGWIALSPQYVDGLRDIEGFSHLTLIYYFHRAAPPQLIVTPFLDTDTHGVFATRAASRTNAIGIYTLRLLSVKENLLHVDDLDVLDQTPLLDLKPFVPAFDHRDNVRVGWFAGKLGALQGRTGDARYVKPD